MADTLGEQLAKSMVAKDRDGLLAVLADDVDFKALTPGRFWEASTAVELVDEIVLRRWFEPSDRLEAVERTESGEVEGRHKVTYLLRGTNDDGPFVVEQQAYYDVDGGRIAWLRVLCSGFRSLTA
jgi:ketosteroid isomerase-like protein